MTTLSHSSKPLWQWRPLPSGEDHHTEFANHSSQLPNGFKILAARVRGKKHKHEGSYCDDWFEIAQSDNWAIIAVADGAGSKPFSRVGAKIACEAAVNYLATHLRQHQLTPRTNWVMETFARHDNYQFKEPDIELLQQLLHQAMQTAYQAVVDAYHSRDVLKYYYKALGNRDLTLDDFATTLLLTIHTTIPYKSAKYSLVLTCQLGDGMIAAIYKNAPKISVLTEIDKDNFSGETEFLTTAANKLHRDYLATKTFPFFSPMRTLMVMTDGVADDYFPPMTDGILRLFSDLVINNIIPVSPCQKLPSELLKILQQKQSDYLITQERLTETGVIPTPICSASNYAKVINLPLTKLVAAPELLAAGIPLEISQPAENMLENRLTIWLDTYHLRGSFDDRTLVVLFDEQQSSTQPS
jgi:hypothetical protein